MHCCLCLQGGLGGGPMDFGKNKSKFQEVPETGVTFDDVAVRPAPRPCSADASPFYCTPGHEQARCSCIVRMSLILRYNFIVYTLADFPADRNARACLLSYKDDARRRC